MYHWGLCSHAFILNLENPLWAIYVENVEKQWHEARFGNRTYNMTHKNLMQHNCMSLPLLERWTMVVILVVILTFFPSSINITVYISLVFLLSNSDAIGITIIGTCLGGNTSIHWPIMSRNIISMCLEWMHSTWMCFLQWCTMLVNTVHEC